MADEATKIEEEAGNQPLFPKERTFVLRFDRTTDLKAGRCVGKLESVARLGRHNFADLDELLEQLRKLID